MDIARRHRAWLISTLAGALWACSGSPAPGLDPHHPAQTHAVLIPQRAANNADAWLQAQPPCSTAATLGCIDPAKASSASDEAAGSMTASGNTAAE